jgi:hypothetical protein
MLSILPRAAAAAGRGAEGGQVDNFAEDSRGVLYVVNGFDPMLRWDGQTPTMEPAGLAPPTFSPVMTGSGAGDIVGTYYAYLRFVDRLGYFSNLSPISAQFSAAGGLTGIVENLTQTAPIGVQSTAHGLTTGNVIKLTGVVGMTSANGVWTITVVDVDNFTLDGSSGNAAWVNSGTWVSGINQITYSNVQTTTDPKVVRRQILRNTDGQANVFYADIDTTDLSSTTFTSTNDDTFLAAGIAVPILDSNGLPLANLNWIPPNNKTTLVSHLSRGFMAGQYDETRGSVMVTTGSYSVTGVGTDWVAGLATRYLYVVGAANSYQVASVDVVNQTITLTSPYQDVTDNFADYAIRPPPAERRLLLYTPAGLPESWPPTYALSVQEDDDEITGLFTRGSFLYILERRHIYKFTFQNDPAVDGAIFLSANRGCINNRCWCIVDNDAYMLDEFGIHKFGADGGIEALSTPIQEMFRPVSLYKFRLNWKAARYFHATLYRPQETIRWFVCLGGSYMPRHALCFNYRLERWWIEEFRLGIGGAIVGNIDGVPYCFLGTEHTKVIALWEGPTDIGSVTLGTLRGTVTGTGIVSLGDTKASFSTSGPGSVINAPVVITDGTGKGQVRRVVEATSTVLTVDAPWTFTLGTDSVYQVGGVTWNYKTSWLRLNQAEEQADRRIELMFAATNGPCTMDLRTRSDFGSPDFQKTAISSAQGGNVRTDSNKPDKVIDLTKPTGVVQVSIPGHRVQTFDGKRYLQVELAGVTNADPVAVFQLALEGMGNAAQVSQQS